jgi:hypothetical protein
LPASPFRRAGQSLNQQIEIAKLQAARSMEERRSLDNAFSTALLNIQTEIDTKMDLAKLWGVTDRNDDLFVEIKQLMDEKRKLSKNFSDKQSIMDDRRRTNDELIDNALVGGHCHKRLRSSTSSISTTVGSSTPTSARGLMAAPTPTSGSMMDEGSPVEGEFDSDEVCGPEVDIRECFQPPPPFVFPSHLNDDSD